jgi:hypothetical protein
MFSTYMQEAYMTHGFHLSESREQRDARFEDEFKTIKKDILAF